MRKRRTTEFQQELKEAEKVDFSFFFLFFSVTSINFWSHIKNFFFPPSFFLFGQNLLSFQSHTKNQKMKQKKNRRK
jgi:hypothetical protein